MAEFEWPEWIKNAFSVTGAIGSVAFAVGLVMTALRSESAVRRIPWWWWIGNGAALFIVSQGIDGEWIQGLTAVAGLLSIGAGIPLFWESWTEGSLHLRRYPPADEPTESKWDREAGRDWVAGGSLVKIIQITPSFSGLKEDSPFIDFRMELVSMNIHSLLVSPEATGRIQVPDSSSTWRELHAPPRLHQISERRGNQGVSRPVDGPVRLSRNHLVTLHIRQHVLPGVRDSIRARAGEKLGFNFRAVVFSVEPDSWDPEPFGDEFTAGASREARVRGRLPLEEYVLEIPEHLGRTG